MRGLRFLSSVVLFCFLAAATHADDYTLVPRTDGAPGYSYHPSPADWRDVNMYQIFTDRFYDGNTGNNNARYSGAWYNSGGPNYLAEVNQAPSSIRWFGNAIQGGTVKPPLTLRTCGRPGTMITCTLPGSLLT